MKDSVVFSVSNDQVLRTDQFDATPYLTAILVVLYGISARMVVGPLGAIGQPALLMAGGGGLLWLTTRALPHGETRAPIHPLKWALFVYLWYELAAIAISHTHSLSVLEQSSSARSAFKLLCVTAVAALVIDGVQTMERLNTFLRRMTMALAFMAVTGILQFLLGDSFRIPVPGLSFNHDPGAVDTRWAFNRPMGTALHPIEFGVVLGAMLPLALHYALEWSGTKRQKNWSRIVAIIVAFAIPLSVSRSAIVAVAASMAFMWVGWGWRRRGEALIVLVAWLPIIYLTVPGLLGTFRGLFTSFDHDPSVQARLERIPQVMQMIREHPWFGHGAGTLSFSEVPLLDNQFFATILASGVVGLVVLLGLIALAMLMSITSRYHRYATDETRHLGLSIAASIFSFTVTFVTFDALYFRILLTTLFMLFGAAGVLWTLTRESSTPNAGGAEVVRHPNEEDSAVASSGGLPRPRRPG